MARIINSPGVQITEKDLSLRVNTPVGTQVYIPGFAAQGPVSEPINITSVSELEAIYGIPTTPAERYFYYSCREVLNSPAVLNTIRLPYGPDAGTAYSNAYSGLFYPATLTVTGGVSSWDIGAPTYMALSHSDYNSILRGDFSWTGTDLGSVDLTPGNATIDAGFFILNDLQTTINELAEGYYIGFIDNTAAMTDSPDFDSIKTVTTLSAENAYGLLNDNRLDFALSATKVNADNGLNSVSEMLEKVGFIGFETNAYQDFLSLGIFKIRTSTADPSMLTMGASERYLGSLNFNRKEASPSGGLLASAYIEDIINSKSSSVRMVVNPAISHSYNWTVNSTLPTSRVTVSDAAKGLYPVGVYTPNTFAIESTKQIGLVPLKLEKALRTIENPENVTVDVLVDAGLSTIYSTTNKVAVGATTSYDDTTYVSPADFEATVQDDWRSVVNVLVNFSENTRKDCFTIIDPHRSIFVQGRDTKVIDIDGNSFTSNIYNPLKACVSSLDTNYAAIYANWIKNSDLFTGRAMWLPFSGYAAAVFGRSDAAAYTWAAPAGLNRGIINNLLDIAFNPNQKQRDRLYEIATNPVVLFNGDGYAVFGQKTLQVKPTAFDRINVRRLFLTLERAVQKTVKYFVFEPNTTFTRKRLVDTIAPIFNAAKNTQGLYDYLIVADERNNTPDTIDNNELIVDIYLKPVRTAEFILVNFIATRTSQNFQELL